MLFPLHHSGVLWSRNSWSRIGIGIGYSYFFLGTRGKIPPRHEHVARREPTEPFFQETRPTLSVFYYYVPTAIPRVASDFPAAAMSIPCGNRSRIDVSAPGGPLFWIDT